VEQICTHVTIINRGQALVSDTLEKVSGMISGPAALQVEVANLSEPVISAVKALPYVKDVSKNNNALNITLTTREDVRAKVSQSITRAGGVIVGMNQKSHSLEDVFIQLINNPNGGKQ
jgi:ABC-type uncharacterized transport system ATPase subunit